MGQRQFRHVHGGQRVRADPDTPSGANAGTDPTLEVAMPTPAPGFAIGRVALQRADAQALRSGFLRIFRLDGDDHCRYLLDDSDPGRRCDRHSADAPDQYHDHLHLPGAGQGQCGELYGASA